MGQRRRVQLAVPAVALKHSSGAVSLRVRRSMSTSTTPTRRNVVFDGYEYVAAQRFASRHSISDVSADAFVYTIDMGSAPDTLKRAVTIRYARD
jgi:hypothetical protein